MFAPPRFVTLQLAVIGRQHLLVSDSYKARRTMKCTGERVVRFLVCLQVARPFPVISTVIRLKSSTPQRNAMMNKWIAVALLFATLHVGRLGADDSPPPLKEGELVHLKLIGDAARTYARMNMISLAKATSPIPVLSVHTVLRHVDRESGIAIEHQYETVVNGDRYLCMLSGTVPSSAIERVPVPDLRPEANLTNPTGGVPSPLGYMTRLCISDFPVFPMIKLQRWKLVSELDGSGASKSATEESK